LPAPAGIVPVDVVPTILLSAVQVTPFDVPDAVLVVDLAGRLDTWAVRPVGAAAAMAGTNSAADTICPIIFFMISPPPD